MATAIWAIIVPAVTVVAVGVSALTIMLGRPSSVATLAARNADGAVQLGQAEDFRVVGELVNPLSAYEGNSSNFRVFWQIPVSAPLATFPDTPAQESGYYSCSPEQIAWLETHAHEGTVFGWGKFDLSLLNTADGGGSLSLSNVRFEGDEVASEPLVTFHCPMGGMGSAGSQSITVGVTGAPAVWGPGSGADAQPEGSVATINLAPGAASPVQLLRAPEVDTQRQYEGRFLADLVDDSGETVILAENVAFRRESAPGFFVGYGGAGFVDGILRCGVPVEEPVPGGSGETRIAADTRTCTLSEAAETLRLAAAAAAS